jgi:hypothetical protein
MWITFRRLAMRLLLALGLLISSVSVAAAEADSRPYVAEAFGVGEGGAIILQRLQGSCPAGLKRAINFKFKFPLAAWMGCWVRKGDDIEIGYEDSDLQTLPVDTFKWVDQEGRMVPSGPGV